jgi:hypothetical protein
MINTDMGQFFAELSHFIYETACPDSLTTIFLILYNNSIIVIKKGILCGISYLQSLNNPDRYWNSYKP